MKTLKWNEREGVFWCDEKAFYDEGC
jgi:hypothetical protein